MEMKRSKRRRRLFIEDIEPNRELTSNDMDLQYLVIINGFISMNNLIQMKTDDKWNSRLVFVHYSMQYVSLTSNESKYLNMDGGTQVSSRSANLCPVLLKLPSFIPCFPALEQSVWPVFVVTSYYL